MILSLLLLLPTFGSIALSLRPRLLVLVYFQLKPALTLTETSYLIYFRSLDSTVSSARPNSHCSDFKLMPHR